MIRTAFSHQSVDRRTLATSLDQLLQKGFVIPDAMAFGRQTKFGIEKPKDKLSGLLEPRVEKHGRDNRLENIAQEGPRHPAFEHPTAHDQAFLKSERFGDLRANTPRDDHRLDLGQIPFQVFGIRSKHLLAHDHP